MKPEATNARTFSLGQVLTALSGTLFCDVSSLYDVLNFLTGEDLYTHQLPRAIRVCGPFVAQQHPDLAILDWSGVNRENVRTWLAEQTGRYGEARELQPIQAGAYEAMDPIDEAVEMRGEA